LNIVKICDNDILKILKDIFFEVDMLNRLPCAAHAALADAWHVPE